MADDNREWIKLRDGRVGRIAKDSPGYQQAIQDGAEPLNSADIEKHRKKSFGENLKDEAEEKGAGLLGVARGATLGGSDEAAIAVGGDAVRNYFNRLKTDHPYYSGIGEVEGTIIPGLMTGGAAAAPKAAAVAPLLKGVAEEAAPKLLDAGAEALGEGAAPKLTHALESGGVTPDEVQGEEWLRNLLKGSGKGSAGTTPKALPEAVSEASQEATKADRLRPSLKEVLADDATNPQGAVKRARDAQKLEELAPQAGDTNPGLQAQPRYEAPPRPPGGQEFTRPGMGEAPIGSGGAYDRPPSLEPLEATNPGVQAPREAWTTEPAANDAVTGTRPGVGEAGPPLGEPPVQEAIPGELVSSTAPPVQEIPKAPTPEVIDAFGKTVLADSGIGKAAGVDAATQGPNYVSSAPNWTNLIPSNMVGHIGDEVEKGILKLLGPEARSTVGKMLQEGIASGARGTVEGGILGGVDQMNEDRLGNVDTNGEKMLAAVGHGALLGGLTGGAFGSGRVLTKAVAGYVANQASRMAGEQAFRALNPADRWIKEANRVPGGASGIGQFLIDKKILRSGQKLEDVAPGIIQAKENAGKALGAIIDGQDSAGIAGPQLERIIGHIDGGVMQRLEKLPSMNSGAINRIQALKTDLAAVANEGRLGFRQAQELRARIDDAIKWNTNPLSPVNEITEGLKGARKAIEDEIEAAIEKSSGPKAGEIYKDAKLTYRKLKVASDTVESALDAKATRRVASPTDYISALGVIASGHPVLGLAAGLVHHIVRERGNSTLAVLLDKAASFGAVERASSGVDRQIARGVKNVFGEKAAAATTREKLFNGDHEERAQAVARAVIGTTDHVAAATNAVSPIASNAPRIAGAFTKSAIRITSYLSTLLPKGDQRPSLTPHLDKVYWTDSEKYKFNNAFDIAHDPVSILDHLADGTVTPDQVKAMREMYPELYAQMADELGNKLAAKKEALPGDKRYALAVFLGDPSLAGPTLEPQFILAMQANYPTEHGLPVGPQKKKGKGKGKTPKVSDLDFVSNEKLEGLNSEADDD